VGDSEVLKQFLGDGDFPIDWASEEEKELFWSSTTSTARSRFHPCTST
jgi:hypothetical protein